jgi:hypothetical protein
MPAGVPVPELYGEVFSFAKFAITLRDGTADSVSITISAKVVMYAVLRKAWHRDGSLNFKETILMHTPDNLYLRLFDYSIRIST